MFHQAAMQYYITNSTVDIYAENNNITSVLTTLLAPPVFFHETFSVVTLVSDIDQPGPYIAIWSAVFGFMLVIASWFVPPPH